MVLMGQPPRLCQGDQVLMPIQFPDDFVVADLIKIKKIDFEPRLKRGTFSVHNVEMPINLRAIIKILVSQQGESMAANIVGFADNRFNFRGKVFFQQTNPAGYLVRRDEESFPGAGGRKAVAWALQAHAILCEVKTLMEFLPSSGFQLIPTRVRQPSQNSAPS
jgi:hypothetical protein